MSLISKLAVFAGVTLSSAYIYTALRGPQGLPSIAQKMEEIRAWQRKNADLKHEIEERQRRLEKLRLNKAEQELEIRKRMTLVHPGETVFVITNKPVPKLMSQEVKQPAPAPVVSKPAETDGAQTVPESPATPDQ
jgi:cell division protein FtsB